MFLILFLVSQSWSVYLDSTLSFIGLSQRDITFRTDYTLSDPYRFSIIDSLLNKPLHSIDFATSIDSAFWNLADIEILQCLINIYPLATRKEELHFRYGLQRSYELITEAVSGVPQKLDTVFENLTLFSPQPTTSIEEEKESEITYDSLVTFLKDSGIKVDYSKLFTASLMLLWIAHTYTEWPLNYSRDTINIDGVEGEILYYETCDFGEIIVGGAGNNIYKKDFAIMLDLGGDDVYHCSRHRGNFQILIDRAGNDVYKGEDYSIACGNFGVSIIIDEGGDDMYEAKNYAIGCGIFGIGVLIDKDGHDTYTGDTFTQGAGGFGIGILKDEAGQDTYEAALYAQGFASTYGIGILADRNGNDQYSIIKKYIDEIRYLDHYLSLSQGFSIGFRPDLSAGIGMILDQRGNDYYLADIFAQGSSYWYGFGAIIDSHGNDNYIAHQYAQGAGTHITIGVLIDKQGDDTYVAKGVSQGCGHDLAFGFLLDCHGDDSYVAFDLSQGAGNANGIGMLLDESGSDSYSAKRDHNTQGYGDFRREYGSIGILLDIAGEDVYRTGTNESLWLKGAYGVGIDWE
jgi:hypothetical protein